MTNAFTEKEKGKNDYTQTEQPFHRYAVGAKNLDPNQKARHSMFNADGGTCYYFETLDGAVKFIEDKFLFDAQIYRSTYLPIEHTIAQRPKVIFKQKENN